jgi:antitoxin VapB
MKTARLFNNGRSQAVRLPKEYRFKGTDVYVKKFDNIVMLFPMSDPWVPMIDSLDKFSNDFMVERNQPRPETRASVK